MGVEPFPWASRVFERDIAAPNPEGSALTFRGGFELHVGSIERGASMPMNTRILAWFVVLPVLALVPAFAGPRPRAVAPAATVPPAIVSIAAAGSGRGVVANESLTPIYFAAGTTQIRPSDTKILDAHAVWLRRDRRQRLLIEGHTDGVGDSAFSREVGERRAKAAQAYLVSKGVSADHIAIVSRGGGRPACREKTATCRAANRRATFSTRVQQIGTATSGRQWTAS